ncbi:MAG: alpha/beta hydrolase [Acidimicrobiia bacterium]|nr:alpha/beta hydrolase [Acidimicrobiia bacterium]
MTERDAVGSDDAPEIVYAERDGLRIRALDWGGTGEPLLLLHPNGFGAGVFEPLALAVRDRFRPIAVDLRGHGGSGAPATSDGFAYAALAGDVVAILDALAVTEAVACGQSLGGGVTVLVDRARPGMLRRVLLCEAIAFPYDPDRERSPLAANARKRRAVFADRDTIVAAYARRMPLAAMAPEALAAYVRWGTVEQGDGTVRLACDPEHEATIFEFSAGRAGAPDAWEHLPALAGRAVVAAGTTTDLDGDLFQFQALRAGAAYVEVEGGHFFLQEDTGRAAGFLRSHLGG